MTDYPHKCTECQAPAYQGICPGSVVQCRAEGCKHWDGKRRPPPIPRDVLEAPTQPVTPWATPAPVTPAVGQYWREVTTGKLWVITSVGTLRSVCGEVDLGTGIPAGHYNAFPSYWFADGSLEHVPYPFAAPGSGAGPTPAPVQVGQVWRSVQSTGDYYRVLSFTPGGSVMAAPCDSAGYSATGSRYVFPAEYFTDGTLELVP